MNWPNYYSSERRTVRPDRYADATAGWIVSLDIIFWTAIFALFLYNA